MPKLTAAGQPTIGYIHELAQKDKSELTAEELKILGDFEKEFYDLAVKPFQANYKNIIFPTVKNIVQFRESYISTVLEAQKSILIFNSEFTQQIQNLYKFSCDIKRAVGITMDISRQFQSIFATNSNFSSLINKIVELPKIGEEFKRNISVAASFSLTFKEFKPYDGLANYYSLGGSLKSSTKLEGFDLRSNKQLELKVERLESKVEQLNSENKLLLNQIYKEIKTSKQLVVIAEAKYNRKESALHIIGENIPIPIDSDQESLCVTLFKNDKTINRVWYIDEVVSEGFGDQYNSKEKDYWDKKVRAAVRRLNENIAINTSPLKDGIIRYSKGELRINQDLLKKLKS